MNSNFTEAELKEIENQLKCPSGDFGLTVAQNMNKSNVGMTQNSIKALDIHEQDSILELGPGNGNHVSKIMEVAPNLSYVGLDISETMINEAKTINNSLIENYSVQFKHYDEGLLPFSDESFDKIFTVNTLYFWEAPVFMLNELYRVLKINGLFVISFAQKDFLEKLPYVGEKFNLFSMNDFEELIELSSFEIIHTENFKDEVTIDDNTINRTYSIVELHKF